MTIYFPEGKDKTKSLDFDTTQFSISGTTVSVGTAGNKAVSGPATNTANYIPQWNGADSALLKDGVELSTDGTMGGNSDSAVPTEQAVVEYVASSASAISILDSAVASTTVGNTAVETTLYTFSIPANTLGTANALRLVIIGTLLQNATKTLLLKAKYGSTTIISYGMAPSNNASALGFKYEVFLVAQGATNSQFAINRFSPFETVNYGTGTAAEDSTGALDLVITAQWSGASASATLTSKYAILEKITGV